MGSKLVAALATGGAGVVALALIGLAAAEVPAVGGYLHGREPDTVLVVPQAPTPGSPRDVADRDIFRATRSLKDTPRWRLAQNDAILTVPAVLTDFSCAAGVRLDAQNAPALARVMQKVVPDLVSAYSQPKNLYKRPRPYLRDKGDICVARSPGLDASFDYPSGHATFGWTWALILADLAPDRAGQILGRARAFGESRAVCGVHSVSAITEARSAGSTLFAALQSDPAFQADMQAARAQLDRLRAAPTGPGLENCEAQAALTAKTPW